MGTMGTHNGYGDSAVTLGGDKERYRGQQTPSKCSCWRRVLQADQENGDTTANGEKLVLAL
jgi:hypothetical protein